MRGLLRLVLLAITAGVTLAGGAAVAAAQPPADDVEMPGILTAFTTCDEGGATVTVWIDDNTNDPIPVRLDRLRPDTATRTANTVIDDDRGMHVVVFDAVAVGDYNVHINGRDGVADDLPVVVKACRDLEPEPEPLTIQVECKAGWGIATFRVSNPGNGQTVDYTLAVDHLEAADDIELREGLFLNITQNALDDGTHLAQLSGSIQVRKEFTVSCIHGNAPALDVTVGACSGHAAQATVAVANPNRESVDYRVTVRGTTKTVSLGGGRDGTVTFADLPTGEYPVRVEGSDRTESATAVKIECGQPPTSPTTTTTTSTEPTTTTTGTTTTGGPGSSTATTTPVPQGDSDGLATTGAAVRGLVGLGALVLVVGVALVMLVRRRRAHQD